MFRPRVIPVLLLKGNGLVKSVRFKEYRYIGDPINAVKLFNDLGADELVFLDIMANQSKNSISTDFVMRVGEEANMPFSVGGGIRTIREIGQIVAAGAEKVILGTFAIENPEFVREASQEFGSSTIAISIDVKKSMLSKDLVYIYSGKKSTVFNPVILARLFEEMGAGEIIINSIDRDGTMQGYDISLIQKVSEAVSIPVVALGGAGKNEDLKRAVSEGYASAVAAGSMFIYHGPRKAVLINYPDPNEISNLFK